MSNSSKRALYWTPRILCIAFLAFLSLFSLDVFGEGRGFWQTLLALFMHLVPVFVLIAALALAWRWEWIGTAMFASAGALYVWFALSRPWPAGMKAVCILMISGPALAVAGLFLANWLKRAELRARG